MNVLKGMRKMNVWEIVGGVVMIIMSIAIIVLVGMQESPKGSGISALTGGDSYYNRNQGRTLDAMLSRFTKYLGIIFFVVTIAVYAMDVFMK